MNGKHSSSSQLDMPDIEVFLSRPAYPLGESVVGTILIRPSPGVQSEDATGVTDSESLRSQLSSVVVYVAGYCQIDARWHNVDQYTKLYGENHPMLQLLYQDFDPDLLSPQANVDGMYGNAWRGKSKAVCFWATNGIEVLELEERTEGAWIAMVEGDQEVLAFTFRVDIPLDLPHTTNSSTCRYHYSADVLVKAGSNQRVIKTPFSVWANPHQPLGVPRSQQVAQKSQQVVISGGRVKVGTIQAMAHSNGLPCHLSATEIHRPKGQMTVALPRTREDVQTLRVSNALGQSVCVLTVVGATKLTPGSRIHLQWDFPERISATKDWIPCHQVSSCLMGEEFAVYEDGKSAKTQSYVFDTCHEWVDPGVTHRVSKTLLLSSDAPSSLYTDLMDVSIRCQVDISVKENGEYNNLRLELPCQVVQSFGEEADVYDEEEEDQVLSLSELLGRQVDEPGKLPTTDIASDLKILALKMEERLKRGSGDEHQT